MPTYHTPRCYHCFLLWNYHMSFVAEFCSNWRKCQLDRPELVVYLPGSRHWCLFCLTVNKVLWRSCCFFFKFLVISINQNSVIDSKVQFFVRICPYKPTEYKCWTSENSGGSFFKYRLSAKSQDWEHWNFLKGNSANLTDNWIQWIQRKSFKETLKFCSVLMTLWQGFCKNLFLSYLVFLQLLA